MFEFHVTHVVAQMSCLVGLDVGDMCIMPGV